MRTSIRARGWWQVASGLGWAALVLAAGCGGEDPAPATADSGAQVVADTAQDAAADAGEPDLGAPSDLGQDSGCSCAGIECGYPLGCATSCGPCPQGKKCSNNKCIVGPPSKKLKKMGQWCGPYLDCQPPPSGASDVDLQNYYACLDDQCETNDCSGNVCTSKCVITKDKVANHSGEKGADGIEDPDADSDCAGAVDGPHGEAYRCIELRSEAQIAQGQNYQICRAGTTFKPCENNADCPGGENCHLLYLMGEYQNRCQPKFKQPSGKEGATFSHACNSNPFAGDLSLCQSGTCFGWGCMEFCKTDQDCVTAPGACKASKCPDGAACKDDTDCSAWRCEAGHTIYSNVDKTFQMCWPKHCSVDKDCNDEEFYCRLAYNGVANPNGDPDPDDPNKVIKPAWDNYCRRRLPGTVAKGENCDPYSTDNIKTYAPCQNPFACDNGTCGGYCDGDGDCPTGMSCGVSDIRFDTDDPDDGIYDVFLAYGSCVSLPGASTKCYAQADCGDGFCKGWSHANAAAVDDKEAPAWTSDGMCVIADGKKGSFGATCGALGDGKLCKSGWCANTTSGSGKAQAGFCTDLCGGRDECPPAVKLYNTSYKTVCRSYKQTYNETAPPMDDNYLPYCWVSNNNASLEDCSGDKICASAKEACRAYPIAFGPDKPIKMEFWCSWNQNSSGAQPDKKDGEQCELESSGYQCLGGYCLSDSTAGKGYCSRLCGEDADCGPATDGMFCDLSNMGFPGLPRADANMAGIAPMCRKKKACIPCNWDHDCGGDFRCTNIGGPGTLANLRCAAPCLADKECGDGGTCKAAIDSNGKPTAGKVCAPKCG